ncbi:carbohydrate kinase family protein [Acuticoccus mangrovi]|uniref:Carbohydrate kinase n=1 Tax=Acuticoccus mangrovi TaxID=2796142 RepID=A0A934IE81_9HYPH|nr:carbohydrate kinase [Acuticoccus mangrovi]MBJ3774964.1 carbohydrate kinase [Acuticoccus mangrovi]
MTVLICGEALYDVFFAGESVDGFTLDARIGGSAFNVAVGLSRLGRSVGLLTGISRDALGDKLVRSLAAERVEITYLKRTPAPTTLALVSVEADGSARYRFYGEGAADRQVTPADIPPLDGIDALVFGCFSMLTRPTGDTFLALAEAAGSDRLVVLDPNVRPSVEPDMAVWRERVERFAAHADIIKVSAEDMAALYDEPADVVARRWRAAGTAMVALTLGGEGARLFHPAGETELAAPLIAVVDTVGAGDSFLAALLAGLGEIDRAHPRRLATLTEEEARRVLTFAVAASAMTCTRRGADLPERISLPAV